MNITVVSDVLGDETNGTTIAAMNLIRHLKSKGHKVKILCADADKKGTPDYYIVPNLNLGVFNSIVRKNNVTLAKPKDDIVEEALKDADHIHIILPFTLGRHAMRYAREHNISTTAGFHAQAENLSSHVRMQGVKPVNYLIYRNFYKGFYKYIDGIHYPTQFIRDTFEHSIKKHTNGYVISNGVNSHIERKSVKKPQELKDKIVILTTGRYAVEKDQATLFRAVNYSKYKDKIQLVLAGQGPLTKKYERMARKVPIQPIMKCFSREEMANVLNYCDIYAHPAIIELEGIACLEAICAGKLVIVSDSKKSATKNFAVDEKCIFKKRNPKDLARVIDYFIEHPEEKKICEEKYLASAHLFNQVECMERMEQMINEVHEAKKQSLLQANNSNK